MLDFSMLSMVLLAVGALCLFILLFYYIFLFSKALLTASASTDQPPVSVVIAARNELKNLQENIPSILHQNYPNYEVVVINDCSFDGTQDYLDELSKSEPRLKVVTLEIDERFQRGKKFALTMGIKAAAHERLLFTDADCKPQGDEWISSMAKSFRENTITLGLAPLTTNNSLLGSIIKYETLHTAVQYLGYANRDMAYIGVGRNLYYTKSLFFANKGFASHQHIMSGDDDLFVQQASLSASVNTVTAKESFTYSPGPRNLKAYFKQKIRHLSTGKEYSAKSKRWLGIYSLSHLGLYLTCILFISLNPEIWYIGLAVIILKWIVQWIIIGKIALHMGTKKVAYALPYYDILYTLFLLIFGIAQVFIKPKTWN